MWRRNKMHLMYHLYMVCIGAPVGARRTIGHPGQGHATGAGQHHTGADGRRYRPRLAANLLHRAATTAH